MIKSKALDIIQRLSPEERRDFRQFIISPYFNRKSKVEQLCEIILENVSKLDEPEMTEERLFSPLFDKEKYSYSFVRNLMSELLRLCEIFLIVNRLNKNSYADNLSGRILLNEFNTRFLDKQFELKLKKIRDGFTGKKIDTEYFDMMGKIEAENIAFHLYRSSYQEVPELLLKRAEYNLVCILQLLEFDIMDLAVNKAAFNLDFSEEPLSLFLKTFDTDRMLELVEKGSSVNKDEMEIRLRLIKLCDETENDNNYFRLKELVLSRISLYTNAEGSNMFTKLKNYCGFRIYMGAAKFFDEKYALSKSELETVKYNSDGVGPLFANFYLEMIQRAILLKDLEFAENVIDNFTRELEPSKQKSVSSMARALLSFERKEFEKTLEHLANVNTFGLFLKVRCKMLYMKTYYELNVIETGLSSVESFRHFINETKELTKSRKESLKNNHEIIRRLYKLKFNRVNNRNFEINELKRMVEHSDIYYADWYLEKLDELA